jgi:hypothetical protein
MMHKSTATATAMKGQMARKSLPMREQGGQAYTFDDLPGLDVFFSKTECG